MCLDEYELRVGLNYDRFQEETFNKKGDWCVKSTRKKPSLLSTVGLPNYSAKTLMTRKVGRGRNTGLALLCICTQQSAMA